MIDELYRLKYSIDQELYLERMWNTANKYLEIAEGEAKEYAEGMIQAIRDFQKNS